jgi:hypothetical protein
MNAENAFQNFKPQISQISQREGHTISAAGRSKNNLRGIAK